MNFFGNIERVLFVSAHPDDMEINAGGLVQILRDRGVEIRHHCLSNPVISLPHGFPQDSFLKEIKASYAALKLPEEDLSLADFPVRNFPEYRQKILDHLIEIRQKYNPDLIISHSANDMHQDHQTVAQEVQRAFRASTILCYVHPWNVRERHSNLFVELSEKQMQAKIDALACYKSQVSRQYCQADNIKAMAKNTGLAIGVEYAEAFFIYTMAMKLSAP